MELLAPVTPPHLFCGAQFEKALANPTFGVGRGAPGHKRARHPSSLYPTLSWTQIRKTDDSARLQPLIHISVSQFEALLSNMLDYGLDVQLSMLYLLLPC